MICYTNHALDQFLEYCVDQCKLTSGVIRVGSQSKSEKLKPFQLSAVKFNNRRNRAKNSTNRRLGNEVFSLKTSKNQLESILIVLWKVSRGEVLLKLNVLLDYMSESHRQQFYYQSTLIDDVEFFLDWLGFFETELTKSNNQTTYQDKNLYNFIGK